MYVLYKNIVFSFFIWQRERRKEREIPPTGSPPKCHKSLAVCRSSPNASGPGLKLCTRNVIQLSHDGQESNSMVIIVAFSGHIRKKMESRLSIWAQTQMIQYGIWAPFPATQSLAHTYGIYHDCIYVFYENYLNPKHYLV